MEISSIIFLYILTGVLVAVIFLIISNLRQNKKLNRALEELYKVKKDLSKIQENDHKILNLLHSEDPAYLDVSFSESKVYEKKSKRKSLNFFTKIMNFFTDVFKLEQLLGLKVLDKIGIISFLIGIAFFVSVAMELDWIDNFARLFFGVLLSGILIIFGYLLYKRFPNFSSVIFGGSVATLIFTIFAAFYKFHLLNTWISLLILAVVISASILISVVIDKQQLSILTFLAAFMAPFTVHIQGADYFVLFVYLTLINLGVIIYDYFKKSIIINLISFVLTFSIYTIWFIKEFLQRDDIPLLSAFVFLTIFYIMIFIILIINNIRENRKFIPLEFTGLITATALYYSVGIILINKTGMDYQGVFTAFIAVIQYTYFVILYPKKNFDRRILNLFLSLTIMFAALTVPVEYFGKSVTLVWAIQAAALLYIAIRSDLKPMYGGSLNLTIGTIATLIYNIYDQYISTITQANFKPFLNEGFFTSLIASLSLLGIIALLSKSPYDFFFFKFLKVKVYKAILGVIAFATLYFTVKFELQYYLMQITDNQLVINTYLSIFNFSILFLLMLPSVFVKKKILNIVGFVVGLLMFAIYLFYYSGIFANLRNTYLLSLNINFSYYAKHFISAVILFLASLIMLKNSLFLSENNAIRLFATSLSTFVLIFVVCAEITNIYVVKNYDPHILILDLVKQSKSFYYTIALSVISFLMIVFGIIFNHSYLRINAFFVYLIAFLKVLIYDFRIVDHQQLTISFIVLGLIMLISALLIQIHFSKNLKNTNYGIK